MYATETTLNNPNATDDILTTILNVAMQKNEESIIKKVIVYPGIGPKTTKMLINLKEL